MPDNSTAGTDRRKVQLRVFQIAYDEALLATRAELLKSRGHRVDSALGNDAARSALSRTCAYDLFIVGYATEQHLRRELIDWIRGRFPGTKILALNPPHQTGISQADYNVEMSGPGELLDAVEKVFA